MTRKCFQIKYIDDANDDVDNGAWKQATRAARLAAAGLQTLAVGYAPG